MNRDGVVKRGRISASKTGSSVVPALRSVRLDDSNQTRSAPCWSLRHSELETEFTSVFTNKADRDAGARCRRQTVCS